MTRVSGTLCLEQRPIYVFSTISSLPSTSSQRPPLTCFLLDPSLMSCLLALFCFSLCLSRNFQFIHPASISWKPVACQAVCWRWGLEWALVPRIPCYIVKQEQSGFLDRVSQCTGHREKASSLNTEPWAVLAPFCLWPSCPHFWQSVFLTVKFSAIQYCQQMPKWKFQSCKRHKISWNWLMSEECSNHKQNYWERCWQS